MESQHQRIDLVFYKNQLIQTYQTLSCLGNLFDCLIETARICFSNLQLVVLFIGTLVKFVEREDLGVRTWVHDVAVYRDKVFLGCGDGGLRRYTMKY